MNARNFFMLVTEMQHALKMSHCTSGGGSYGHCGGSSETLYRKVGYGHCATYEPVGGVGHCG